MHFQLGNSISKAEIEDEALSRDKFAFDGIEFKEKAFPREEEVV